MSAGMPELGSKISLISKADIRYEGRLFTVDPQECTIALANVKSFGTEDRETQFPVAPQNQVYEYILFRGSDIKDIRVVTNVSSVPNDPAIVQMTVQPPLGQQSYQSHPGFSHPMMSQISAMGGQFNSPYGMSMGAIMGMGSIPNRHSLAKPSELGLGSSIESSTITISNTQSNSSVDTLQKDHSQEDGVLDMINLGSRSTTPTTVLRKSPTIDQGVQVNQQKSQSVGKIGEKQNIRIVQVQQRDRDSVGSIRVNSLIHCNEGKQREHKENILHNQNLRNRGSSGPNIQGGGWINQRNQVRGSRGGRGNFRSQQLSGSKPKNMLKFENDYDFEQANTEFEELRSQLAKTKIDSGPENEKKEDSGNETGAGDNEPEEESEIIHYDKTKSFFDNISCEAVERSKGRSQRTDWRTERKLNSETFGVASMRRGSFRGGRGYYNRSNLGNGMYRNNQASNNLHFRGGFRGQRPGNLRRAHGNSNEGSTSSNQNRITISNSGSAEQVANNLSSSTSPGQAQQNNHLVTSNA